MKAYLIDPHKMQVTEVEIGNDYREINELLHCDIFTAVTISGNGDAIFVDDEGLFVADQVFFLHTDYPYQPLAGYGLVLGCDMETGESRSPICSLEETIKKVSFLTRYQVSLWLSDHPDA